MNCERMETLLVGWLDGRAAAGERQAVEAHLAACDACRRRAEEFRALWAAMDEAEAVEPSPDFDARLRQRIEAEPRPRRFGWLLPAPKAALAFVALLVAAVWISTLTPVPAADERVALRQEEEFKMIRDLGVLENYEVLANFEVLAELPENGAASRREM
jgi:anti-sigma factor RsiW